MVRTTRRDLPGVYVWHPGYVDAYLLKNSSLHINRAKEVEMLTDPAMRTWLEREGVELISYNDIGN